MCNKKFNKLALKLLNRSAELLEAYQCGSIQLKKLVPLLEQWFETVTGGWSDKKVELIINVKEDER